MVLRRRVDELAAQLSAARAELAAERGRHEEARLDGALKTARLVNHELRNVLSPLAGYSELLARRSEGENAQLAGRLKESALRAAAFLIRLDQIRRYEEMDFGGQTMLDLDAAIRPT